MLLEGKELSLIYQLGREDEHYALYDLNLSLQTGEMIGLTGPSGSGKSSLLYVMSGLKLPTFGTVFYQNQILDSFTDHDLALLRKNNFGFIFQRHNLIEYLTVMHNVLSVVNKEDHFWWEQGMFLLNELKISHLVNKRPFQLSMGQRQKVAVARALINNPKIIFADEPTACLDHKNAQLVMDILAEHKKQAAVIVATHDRSILEHANRIIEMWDGRIIKIH